LGHPLSAAAGSDLDSDEWLIADAFVSERTRMRTATTRVGLTYLMFPVCPSEYRPGCGHTVSPCGSAPTGIDVTAPLVVSIA
jgi:hypothetical protein